MKTSIILALFIAILLHSQPAFSVINLTGKLTGWDSQPMKLADVQYRLLYGDWQTKQVNDDGSFNIPLESQQLYELSFSGVDHSRYNFQIFTIDKALNLSVKLAPLVVPKWADHFFIVGNFNNYSCDKGFIEMKPDSGGIFRTNLKFTQDTLLYQIMYRDGRYFRTFNSTMSEFFQYDSAGDYRSGIINKKKQDSITINFEPEYFYNEVHSPEVSSTSKEIEHELEIMKLTLKYYNLMIDGRYEILDSIKNYKSPADEFRKNKIRYLDSIDTILKGENDEWLRIFMIMNYIKIASDGVNVETVKDFTNSKYIRELFRNVSSKSKIWTWKSYSTLPVYAARLIDEFPASEYLDSLINSHPSEDTKASNISGIIGYAEKLHDTLTLFKYYDILQEKYPDSRQADYARREYSKLKKIQVDKYIPEFEVVNLDNPDEKNTNKTLKGKYVLIDFWSLRCAPCILEMPNLEKVYKEFKARNFEILSIALGDKTESVKKFRGNKMPWLNSVVEQDTESEIGKSFEVTGFPTTILIDPDGKIIALQKLRGDDLVETLKKYLK